MKNYFRDVTSRLRMINNLNNEINKYSRIFLVSNKRHAYEIFVIICARLRKRYYNILFKLKIASSSFKLILEILNNSDVTLSLFKYHFAYSSIKALNHYVLRLKLSTLKEKVNAILAMIFLTTLRKLETDLDFFECYRKFISHYAAIARSLIALKTRDFKNNLMKD